MRISFSPRLFASICGLILFAQVSVAQTCSTLVPTGTATCAQVFSAVNIRTSQTTAGYSGNAGVTPDVYNSSTVSLTCNTPSIPIIATLSGPLMNAGGTAPAYTNPTANPPSGLQAGGPLLVDNNLFVGVNSATPTDVCTGFNQGSTYLSESVPPGEAENCFEAPYAGAINYPAIPSPLDGDDPDTTAAFGGTQTVDVVGGLPVQTFSSGGVGAIDISGMLSNSATPQNVTIQLQDDGGIKANSTIFLNTNCTVNGITGGTVSGNTINGSTGQGANQQLPFNSVNNENVSLTYNITGALPTISANQTGSSPVANDVGVAPTLFQQNFVSQTSFATSNCFVHSGELLNGVPACKLYTLVCTNQTTSAASGALCPVSTQANEVIAESFDGPNTFTLPNIYTPYGINREGIGFLMASDTWLGTPSDPGGNCGFDPSAGNLDLFPCPLNLLTSFTGPGGFGSQGQTTNPNSTFISVYGVPEDFTSVLVAGEWPDNWVNTNQPKVYFYSQSPNFTKGAYTLTGSKLTSLPNATNYVPQPIKSISYGVTTPGSSVPNPINEPIPGDAALTPSPAPSCSPGLLSTKSEPNFAPPPVTLELTQGDGKYLLHYYAEDCAGTQELQFTQAPGTPSNPGSWSTSFFTYPVNVDTVAPKVASLTLSAPNGTGKNAGTYNPNTTVTATYNCTDAGQGLDGAPNTGSGVVLCGTSVYGPETTYNTGTLTTKFSAGSAGKKTFTVYTADGAGNITSKSVSYTVN